MLITFSLISTFSALIQCLSCLSAASLDDAQIRLLFYWIRHAAMLAIWKVKAIFSLRHDTNLLSVSYAPRHGTAERKRSAYIAIKIHGTLRSMWEKGQ